ncbi:jg26248 [Pararge aegeria aegeria]|uniref:Jg26248 protein n=1 Tax=Pararge aegeria aegeria TaxID=348720 RepID=A0A8S4QST3_9NEOP|nr:jg26248 [Pararge aegeria aegeria]
MRAQRTRRTGGPAAPGSVRRRPGRGNSWKRKKRAPRAIILESYLCDIPATGSGATSARPNRHIRCARADLVLTRLASRAIIACADAFRCTGS